MKISDKLSKFQEGGVAPEGAPMPAEQAPQEGAAQDPIVQLAQMAQQAVQSQDCNAAMAVCEGFLQLIQSAQGGGGEAPAPEGQPVYKSGGKLTRRIK